MRRGAVARGGRIRLAPSSTWWRATHGGQIRPTPSSTWRRAARRVRSAHTSPSSPRSGDLGPASPSPCDGDLGLASHFPCEGDLLQRVVAAGSPSPLSVGEEIRPRAQRIRRRRPRAWRTRQRWRGIRRLVAIARSPRWPDPAGGCGMEPAVVVNNGQGPLGSHFFLKKIQLGCSRGSPCFQIYSCPFLVSFS